MKKTCVKESKILSNTSVNFAKLNFPCQNHILWAFVRFLLSGVSICPVSICPHTVSDTRNACSADHKMCQWCAMLTKSGIGCAVDAAVVRRLCVCKVILYCIYYLGVSNTKCTVLAARWQQYMSFWLHEKVSVVFQLQNNVRNTAL